MGNHPWLIPKDGFDETVDLDAFLVMVQGAFAVFCGYLVLQIRRRASGERRTRRRSERCRHRGLNLHASPPRPSPPRTTRSEAQRFAGRLGLHVNEVMQFQRNYYAKLVDGNGNGATEVLVDPTSGLVSIEYGPAMMCNTRYGMGRAAASMMGSYGISMMGGSGDSGMMGSRTQGSTSSTRVGSTMDGSESGGMMGGSGSGGMMGGPGGSTTQTPATSSANTAVSMADARWRAQRWLDANERA